MNEKQEEQDMLFETVELQSPENTDTSTKDVIASNAPHPTSP